MTHWKMNGIVRSTTKISDIVDNRLHQKTIESILTERYENNKLIRTSKKRIIRIRQDKYRWKINKLNALKG